MRPFTARACGPTTATRSICSADTPAALRASFHACSPSGTYSTSPNFSSHCFVRPSPGVRHRSRNSVVALAPPRYSATSTPSPSSPISTAAAPSPPADSSALPGRPVRMSAATTKVGPPPSNAAREGTATGTNGAGEIERRDVVVETKRRVDGRGVRLLGIGRLGGGEPERGRRHVGGRQGQTGRLDCPWWSCPRRTTRRSGCPIHRRTQGRL